MKNYFTNVADFNEISGYPTREFEFEGGCFSYEGLEDYYPMDKNWLTDGRTYKEIQYTAKPKPKKKKHNKKEYHKNYDKNKYEDSDFLLKKKAHYLVKYALKRGDLKKPEKCSSCTMKKKTHAHHEDYSKPLKVIWLCASCHKKLHSKKL